LRRLLIVVMLSVAAAASAAETNTLTFRQALQRAMQVNNTVERARADIDVAQANKELLLSNVMPRITASGSAIRNGEAVTFGSGSDQTTVLAQNDWNYRVVLSQPVFAGRRELRAYSQAKLGIINAQQAELGTEDAVLLRVASNYLAMVNSDARINIEKRNIELAERRRTQANAFFEAGEVTKVDVLRAETAIKASQRVLAVAEQNRQAAESRLRADLDLDGAIVAATPEQPMPAVPDEASLVAKAETIRPDVMLAANTLRIAELEIQKQRGFWLPTITFDGGLTAQKASFPSAHNTYGALRFTVPLLQSGEVEARVAGAKARQLQAKLDLDTAKINAREDVRQAMASLAAAETSLGLAREQLAAAEAEYAQEFELYRAQEATSLDLATSEQSLADARRAVAEESLNRDVAALRVWYASGAMREALNLGGGQTIPSVQPAQSGQTGLSVLHGANQ
jgi:outer membrane protein TolC